MQRTAVNPNSWSLRFGFNQAELVEAPGRLLFCSGQVSVDDSGRPLHADDLRAQVGCALDNLAAVLAEAGMSFANVVRLTLYTTDPTEMLKHFDVLAERLDAAGVKPAQTLLGVAALALPQFKVEIEATAAA